MRFGSACARARDGQGGSVVEILDDTNDRIPCAKDHIILPSQHDLTLSA